MSFNVKEHIIPGQHIRQCDNPAKTEKQVVRLAIKQYTPVNSPSPNLGDFTIIAGHADGFVKELYEPLWEDLVQRLDSCGRKIRSIWIADMSNQGVSGLLNEETKYDDVSWYDHSRDLLHMVNHFREEIVQPVVAIGHSIGGNQLFMLSLAHPTLFSTMILLDPIIAPAEMVSMGLMLARTTLRRRIEWPSRLAAEKAFKVGFAAWDSRVLEKFLDYALYPYRSAQPRNAAESQPVRLVTGRFQELMSFIRPDFVYTGDMNSKEIAWVEETFLSHKIIDLVPCTTLYICGEKSVSAGPEIRKDWLARTGTGAHMGRRGRKRRVEEVIVPGAGHFVPMENPRACAEAAAKWIDEDAKRWEAEEKSMKETWRSLSKDEKEKRANAWMNNLKGKL